jgi:type II secretory pathway pseudopilin PulG
MAGPRAGLDAFRGRLREERGMTVIEVMVAALLLVIGALAVLGVGDAATRNTYRAEQSQVVVNRLQAELEHVRQLPFREVALSSPPPTSADPDNPASRVSGTQFALNRDGTNPQPMAVKGGTNPDGGGVGCGAGFGQPECNVIPTESFQSGDVHGQIYRYVTYPGAPAGCPDCTAADLKRVVIAITIDDTASGGERVYQEVQSDIANPARTPTNNEQPPPCSGDCGEGGQIANFWLTDTACNQTTRQPIAGSHLTHNTRGACSNGLQTGNTRGAPDLMFNELPPPQGTNNDPLFGYGTDVSSQPGLTIRRPTEATTPNGCLLTAPLLSQLDFPLLNVEPSKQQRMHMWLTNQLTSDFRLLTTGSGTLKLWTKSVGAASYSGKICIWVFKRVTVLNLLGQQITVDIPAINLDPPLVNATHFTFQRNPWPTDWTPISVPMNFIWATDALSGLNILGQPRLGLAITVEKGSTTGPGVEFAYDHPDAESRLEVQNDQGFSILGL